MRLNVDSEHEAQPLPHAPPAGTAVDALLEVFPDEVVRRHECGPNKPL